MWAKPGPAAMSAPMSGLPKANVEEVIGISRRSLRLDVRELDHLGPFFDIFGDELGKLARRVRWHRHNTEIGEPLLNVWVEDRRVGLFVERRNDLRRRAFRDAETNPG